MPYIKQEQRLNIDASVEKAIEYINDSGQLNYAITRLVHLYLTEEYNYSRLNETIGVLECAKLELYRRVVAVYEESKIEQNGDVVPGKC